MIEYYLPIPYIYVIITFLSLILMFGHALIATTKTCATTFIFYYVSLWTILVFAMIIARVCYMLSVIILFYTNTPPDS